MASEFGKVPFSNLKGSSRLGIPQNIRHRSAFTLVELLITVAIIGILAAIAVPNFLEAQTRAKVTRALADMRSLRTAVEAYAVDNNAYPIDGSKVGDHQPYDLLPTHVTSPIAYITSQPADPFRNLRFLTIVPGSDESAFSVSYFLNYRYRNIPYTFNNALSSPQGSQLQWAHEGHEGKCFLWSDGPDRGNGPTQTIQVGIFDLDVSIDYDPTNGTLSTGDIVARGFSR
ncbi:MAG: type II secretion system protein GspG [Candidatus Sumerlaeota bacterium]